MEGILTLINPSLKGMFHMLSGPQQLPMSRSDIPTLQLPYHVPQVCLKMVLMII